MQIAVGNALLPDNGSNGWPIRCRRVDTYDAQARRVAAEQLTKAGWRLAQALNGTLASVAKAGAKG